MPKTELKNLCDTKKWAAEFAKSLVAPVTVALHGDLGVGKTEISRAVVQTLAGPDTVVPSPTFTIVQSYEANGICISHFDLYRIADKSELTEIGLDDAIENHITLIEWPEIAADILPADTVHVYINAVGDKRIIEIK